MSSLNCRGDKGLDLGKEEEDGEQDLELVVEEDRVEDLDRSMSSLCSG